MSDLVGLNAQAPDPFATLSKLLSISGQRAQVQQEQQSARQRDALAKYDWNKHVGADGTIDIDSLNDPELMHAAGDQYQSVVAHAIATKQGQLESKKTLLALRNDQRTSFSQMLNALRSDSDVAEDNDKGRQKVNQAMVQYGQMYGEDVLPVLQAYAAPLQKAPKGRLSDALGVIGLQADDVATQQSKQSPEYTDTGSTLQQTNPLAPNAAPTQQIIPKTIAPGMQSTQTADQLGNFFIQQRDARGNITGYQPVPGGPASFGPGERHTLEAQAEDNFKNTSANRSAASMAPQQLDQIDKALDLSKEVSTGAWASKKAQIESGIGSLIPGFGGMDDASKLQELDKFAERIATDASRVLGVNARTDSERESIHKQNANIGYTPEAVQSVLKYAKAQTLAMEAKGNAQEAWLKKDGNGITKQHEFETAFRKAYDPRVFQFESMSEKEQGAYLKGLSKEERSTLAQKTRSLIDLGAIQP